MSAGAEPTTIAAAREGLRAGRWSAVELAEAALARIEQLNPELNAYLHVEPEAALAAARLADAGDRDGALRGIPFCVKDVIDVAGMPTTAGAAGWSRQPRVDAAVVTRLRAAGAIVLGKGNSDEFAYGGHGRNLHRGDCRNPIDPDRVSGGSSSGPAVATATGMALAGIGTDTGGSIRVPASLCGVVGVRPTLGAISKAGVLPLAWSYDAVGPLTRDVADAAIVLEALGVVEPGEGDIAAAPEQRGLRIGLYEELLGVAADSVAARIAAIAEDLAGAGATVTAMRGPSPKRATAVQRIVQGAEAAAVHAPWFEEQRDRYAPEVRTRLEAGRLIPAATYLTAQRERSRFVADFAEAMEGLDLVLAPATAVTAPRRDAATVALHGEELPMRAALLACTLPISQLDCPAISVPAGLLDGLPIGAQLVGRPGSEALLLRAAAAVEALA